MNFLLTGADVDDMFDLIVAMISEISLEVVCPAIMGLKVTSLNCVITISG